jgi:uncharacterized surface protein with fasciclin (FAS1) repeats
LTIFAPSNDALKNAFDETEIRYLESDYGVEAIGRILAGGVVTGVGKREKVGWRDTWNKTHLGRESLPWIEWKKADFVDSIAGEELYVEVPSNGSLVVNGTEAEVVDIFASNGQYSHLLFLSPDWSSGVIHIMPNLLVPENFSLLNSAEKVLLSLNATRFVNLLRTANLSSTYAGEPGKDGKSEQPWTFLAPSDEMLDMLDKWGGPRGSPPLPVHKLWQDAETAMVAEPMKDASPLQALLQYHILPGRLLPGDIKDGMLVETEQRTGLLAGGRQRMRIDVADQLDGGVMDNVGMGDIRFGGATAMGAPSRSSLSVR